jgi:phage-related protein
MATFTFTPSYAPQETTKAAVRATRYADGFEQRIGYGLNNVQREWSLSFNNRDDSETTNIVNFLRARNGFEAFDWTPPRGGIGKWKCVDWSVTTESFGRHNVSATFVEVFEP